MNDDVFAIAKEQADLEDMNYEVRDDYSGRGMFGRTTKGLVIDNWGDAQYLDERISIELAKKQHLEQYDEYLEEDDQVILQELIDEGEYEEDTINNFQMDNMGLSLIIY